LQVLHDTMHNDCGPKCAKCNAQKRETERTVTQPWLFFLSSSFAPGPESLQRSKWSLGGGSGLDNIPSQMDKVFVITGGGYVCGHAFGVCSCFVHTAAHEHTTKRNMCAHMPVCTCKDPLICMYVCLYLRLSVPLYVCKSRHCWAGIGFSSRACKEGRACHYHSTQCGTRRTGSERCYTAGGRAWWWWPWRKLYFII